MKFSQARLIKLAEKFGNKYASDIKEHIQQAVANAASFGPQVHGIMNFPEQLKKDQASLSINVIKVGNTITVADPVVNPPSVAGNYAGLAPAIKKYLEKYIELYPKDAGNVSVTLEYSGVEPGPGVAQR